MTNNIIFEGLESLPPGRPLILQGSVRNHILNYRVHKDLILEQLFDFLLNEKQAPFLLVPAFTFSVFKSLTYSREQDSEIGYISKYVTKHLHYTRTYHPMYSFYIVTNTPTSALKHLSQLDTEFCFGTNTCFDFLVQSDGLQVCLNLSDAKCMTFYHHAEKLIGATHRFEKVFFVNNGASGHETPASVYVRKPGILTDVSGVEQLMWRENIWHGLRPASTSPSERWCSLKECIGLFTNMDPETHKDLLYRVE